jgi:phage FluMu protein Com
MGGYSQHEPEGRAADAVWLEMRCVRCRRLLQKIERQALRPGKRLEIKCGHCKAMNDLVGTD